MLNSPPDHAPPLALLAMLGYAVAAVNQVGGWVIYSFGGRAIGMPLALVSPENVTEWIQVANTALITFGSTAILLYQRSRAKDREAKDREAAEAREAIVTRLDMLAARIDSSASDRDKIHETLIKIDERVDELEEGASGVEKHGQP